MKHTLKLIAGLFLVTLAGVASAADQADVRVSAAVINNCKIQSTEDINFGKLDPAAATDQKASGLVVFACTKNVEYALTLNDGNNFDKEIRKRRMKGDENSYLPYQIERADFSGKGEGFSSPIKVALNAALSGNDYRDLPSGDYVDVVRVTINP